MSCHKLRVDIHGRLLWAAAIAVVLLFRGTGTVLAQEAPLRVIIDWPNEGETFYSGPSSLLYNIPIQGRVSCADCDFERIVLWLDLLQDNEVIASQEGIVRGDGAFTFYVTVNPKNSDGNFGSVQGGSSPDLISCGGDCHFQTELAFPNGAIQVRVTAKNGAGQSDVATRNVVIDRSAYASIPVYVHLIDQPDHAVSGVRVLGSTRLYLWRERHAANFTGQNGQAVLQLEVLSQADTNYVLSVQPTIVDGVLYQGVEPALLDLGPGATTGSQISLAVTRTMGQVEGALAPDLAVPELPAEVWLIDPSSGQSIRTELLEQGIFVLQDIPIAHYLVTLDQQYLVKHGLFVTSKELDLTKEPHGSIVLPGRVIEGMKLSGRIEGAEGEMLPFGWVSPERGTALQSVLPDSGTYNLHGLPDKPVTLTVTSPGYYSQEVEINSADYQFNPFDFTLKPQPGTQFTAWGDGSIVIPAETQAVDEDNRIRLDRGWLWGQGRDGAPVKIQVGGNTLEISWGRFALEHLPGNASWFYLFEGQARLLPAEGSPAVDIEPGQMVNLANSQDLAAVPYDPVVKAALHPNARALLSTTFEPSSEEVIREQTRGLAIGAAQILALVTYSFSALVILLSPLLFVRWWLQRRK